MDPVVIQMGWTCDLMWLNLRFVARSLFRYLKPLGIAADLMMCTGVDAKCVFFDIPDKPYTATLDTQKSVLRCC